ncbi:hypothetical protein C8J56DRAFT_898907 [Mycena floridula]|nr:hypothetical protein C8J56DRAFT_898907 [Mycena floridula]
MSRKAWSNGNLDKNLDEPATTRIGNCTVVQFVNLYHWDPREADKPQGLGRRLFFGPLYLVHRREDILAVFVSGQVPDGGERLTENRQGGSDEGWNGWWSRIGLANKSTSILARQKTTNRWLPSSHGKDRWNSLS